MSQPCRVIIADDHAAVLAALKRILAPHCLVVSTAIDGEELLRQVGDLLPNIVVTDISMPRLNGLDACCSIRRTYPSVRVVIVSELLDDDVIAVAFKFGASAVVRKVDMIDKLPAAVLALS
jgi:DNA-binding NarL/FixJ family response regulator